MVGGPFSCDEEAFYQRLEYLPAPCAFQQRPGRSRTGSGLIDCNFGNLWPPSAIMAISPKCTFWLTLAEGTPTPLASN
jgi:hypothetical protein